MSEPVSVDAPEEVFRVARKNGLLNFSTITPGDAALAKAGNRFDVPGGGVLYAGSTVESCYAETMARFRPTPKIRELVKDEKGFMVAGGIPQDWRLQRVVGTLQLEDALPFLDVESPETQYFLSTELSSELLALGYADNLDFSDVCNNDRRLSRAISFWAYTAADEVGNPLYSGIRYLSRINPAWECWAIFEDTQVSEKDRRSIELHDPDLQKIAKLWGLHPF